MREIKFRGMDIDGRWFYGNLAVLTENVRHLKQGHYISNEVGMPFAYQVRPETVGEYTGLKDRNGKEIYEGDILRYLDACDRSSESGFDWEDIVSVGEIKWDNTQAQFYVTNRHSVDLDVFFEDIEETEVIGNVYQNPELVDKDV